MAVPVVGAGGRMPTAGWFFVLVLGCSVPAWLMDAVAGERPGWLPIDLPLSATMALLPGAVAFVLVARSDGLPAARGWFRRNLILPRNRGWLLLAVVLYPAAMVIAYGVLRLAGHALPDIAFPPLTAAAMLAIFLIGGLGEELGWQGYAYPALEPRCGALGTAVLLGGFWAAWHIVPFLQTAHDTRWIAWQVLTMIPLRVVTVWLFLVAGRSVAVATLLHAFGNLAQFLFPRFGSHYDPFVTFVIFATFALAVIPQLVKRPPSPLSR